MLPIFRGQGAGRAIRPSAVSHGGSAFFSLFLRVESDMGREKAAAPHRVPLEDLYRAVSMYLEREEYARIQDLLGRLHPAEIAAIITGMGGLERNILFDLSPPEMQHEVLVELEEGDQEDLLKRLGDERIAHILLQLESDDATDIAALLDEPTLERVLEVTPEEDREEVQQLLEYDEESAGGLMAVELVTVRSDGKARDAAAAVRAARKAGVEDLHYVYVVDGEGKLEGRIPMVELVLADPDTPVRELLDEELVVVKEHQDQEEVARLFKRYDLISAPVVDGTGKLVGRITVDDIVDVIEEEAEEDLGYLSGTGEEEVTERNIFTSARMRLPWLLVALGGELVGAVVISRFQHSIATMVSIVFFIPAVIALAGNTSVQCSTIVVRGLATGEISKQRIFPRVLREVFVSSLNGFLLAVVFLVIVYVWQGAFLVSVALGLSLLVVCINAGFIGTLVPFVLDKLGQDPALASGPFLSMSNDVLGMTLYFFITTWILT